MGAGAIAFKTILIIQALIFNIAFGILAIVVAAEYANPPVCAARSRPSVSLC